MDDLRPFLLAGIAVCVAILAGLGLTLLLPAGAPPQAPTAASAPVPIGGPFTLVGGDGLTVTDADFRGRFMLVFFGFTHCPDVCPTALEEMGRTLETLGEDSKRVTPVFISVDPERDTPDMVQDYVAFFDTRIVGLTGSDAQIDAVAKAYKVYHEKVEIEGGYTVDHTALTYLMGPDGTFRQLFRPQETPEERAKAIKAAIAAEPETTPQEGS
ncbi:MAG: redoxin domain-containing protein [Alphaproteobacteria bacterium]|nr:redoxin domain-containing protein [Alphaproteobacteria bacterium]